MSIKIKTSALTVKTLENDALTFGFTKNGKSSKNALLNKLIPAFLSQQQSAMDFITKLKNNVQANDNDALNTIAFAYDNLILKRYYQLDASRDLSNTVYLTPTQETASAIEQIKATEKGISGMSVSAFIRKNLAEYSNSEQVKRELTVFNEELKIIDDACNNYNLLFFLNKETGEEREVLPFNYYYGNEKDQTNYFVYLDVESNTIKHLPLRKMQNVCALKEKFELSDELLQQFERYVNERKFNKNSLI